MLRVLRLLLFLLLFSSPLLAQEAWESFYEQYMEQNDVEENGSVSSEMFYEELSRLHAHPLNINTATRQELEVFPFLLPVQIEDILLYLQKNGPMQALGELLLIKSLDYYTRQLLREFIYVGEENKQTFSWKGLLKNSRHEAVSRVNIPLYLKAGYNEYSDDVLARYPNRRYLGEPYCHNLRYRFQCADKADAGFVIEKDAGEPIFSKGFNGYDYYAFYLMLRNVGFLKTAVVGDYRLHFGQGLVMNTGFNLGKASSLSSIGWGSRGIKHHLSVSEQKAFRGAAATCLLWKGVELSAFFSSRRLDANLKSQAITSFKTDGLHRTPLELSKKGAVGSTVYGGNLTFNHKNLHGGVTAVYTSFTHPLMPSSVLYKRFYPRGNEFFTIGTDYMFFHEFFTIAGETAVSRNGAIGTLNKAQLHMGDARVTLLQRYYAHHFQTIHGNSFAENSLLMNESGVYLGVDTHLWGNWGLSAYADICYFPWLKYQVSSSSYSGEGMVRIAFHSSDDVHKSSLRYRIKLKERDFLLSDDSRKLFLRTHHRLRYQQDYSPSAILQMSTLLDYNFFTFTTERKHGYAVTERFSWKPDKTPISLYANASYFHTDGYDTRINIYERGLLYTLSFPSYYGHGYHFSVTCQWVINRRLTTLVHISHSAYFDRSSIGSGTELIPQTHREDIGLQVRWKL